ncbi:hypothetical protein [Dyadobacter frigoris]|uniref:Uncharacterized protein n=1 Tax=Dyadobacter frigoris TaxID=2576211 RepID=A0A4U6D7C0_9BACT|nr:hypothetical protein [Dyadobacter frigoris]TKT93319.1 hypothetical protein FDK13_05560 [Dyadobacter frigoris]
MTWLYIALSLLGTWAFFFIIGTKYRQRKQQEDWHEHVEPFSEMSETILITIPSQEIKQSAWEIMEAILGDQMPKRLIFNGEVKYVTHTSNLEETRTKDRENKKMGYTDLMNAYGILFEGKEKALEWQYSFLKTHFYETLLKNECRIKDLPNYYEILNFVKP